MGGAAGEMKNKAKLSQSWAGLSLAILANFYREIIVYCLIKQFSINALS